MKLPLVSQVTYADIANMLKSKTLSENGTFVKGVLQELELTGKEINAETVEKALKNVNPGNEGKTGKEILTQFRKEASEAVKAMNLPYDTTLEELMLKVLASKYAYTIEKVKPLTAGKLNIIAK